MLRCNDPVLTYLAPFGFNVVRLPLGGLRPGTVLVGEKKELSRLAEVIDLIVSDDPPPVIRDKTPAAILMGRRTGTFDIGVGLGVLENLLSAVGIDAPKLRATLDSVDSIAFDFEGSSVWSLDLLDLGRFLSSGTIDNSNTVTQHFVSKHGAIAYIITDLLVSSMLSVAFSKKDSRDLSLDISALKDAVSVDVTVKSASKSSTTVWFEGDMELAFGFRALKTQLDGGRLLATGMAKTGSVWHANAADPANWASMFPLGEVVINDGGHRDV